MAFHMDEDAVRRAVQAQIDAKIQPQVNSAVQRAVREVRDEYAGESVDQTYTKLVDRIRAALPDELAPNFQPDEPNLRRAADAIAGGKMED